MGRSAPTPADLRVAAAARVAALRDAAAVLSLSEFVPLVWAEVEMDRPFVGGPHVRVVCDALQRQLEGDPAYRRLMLLLPPGFLKSWLAAVARPAWKWLHWPERRSMYVSCDEELAIRDSRRTRMIIESGTYQRLLRVAGKMVGPGRPCSVCGKEAHETFALVQDQNQRANFENSRRGYRQCLGVTSNVIGKRADDVLFDDLVDVKRLDNASSESQRQILEETNATAGYIQSTRVNDPKKATVTLVMQRAGVGDAADVRLAQGGWKVVCLPIRFEPDHPQRCLEDWRTVAGEWLLPERFSEEDEEDAIRVMGVAAYDTQYRQRARSRTGGLLPGSLVGALLRYAALPERFDDEIITVDATFKGTDTSDRVAIHHYGRVGAEIYLSDRDCRRMGYRETKAAILRMKERHPNCRVVLVEDKANGSAILDDLGSVIPGVVPFAPGTQSKWTRAKVALLPLLEARNLLLPEEAVSPWVREVVASWTNFRPNGDDDDDVDAATMMAIRWGLGSGGVGIEVGVTGVQPLLATRMLTRWAVADRSQDYVVGVGADWAVEAASATWAVVLDAEGGQVGRLRIEHGGEEGAAVVIADEAAFWNDARVVVGGVADKGVVQLRLAQHLARLGTRLRLKPGTSLAQAGERAVYGVRDRELLWSRLAEAVRAEAVTVRDAALAGALAGARPTEFGMNVMAVACAVVGRGASSVLVRAKGERRVEFARSPVADTWGRVAAASGDLARRRA